MFVHICDFIVKLETVFCLCVSRVRSRACCRPTRVAWWARRPSCAIRWVRKASTCATRGTAVGVRPSAKVWIVLQCCSPISNTGMFVLLDVIIDCSVGKAGNTRRSTTYGLSPHMSLSSVSIAEYYIHLPRYLTHYFSIFLCCFLFRRKTTHISRSKGSAHRTRNRWPLFFGFSAFLNRNPLLTFALTFVYFVHLYYFYTHLI